MRASAHARQCCGDRFAHNREWVAPLGGCVGVWACTTKVHGIGRCAASPRASRRPMSRQLVDAARAVSRERVATRDAGSLCPPHLAGVCAGRPLTPTFITTTPPHAPHAPPATTQVRPDAVAVRGGHQRQPGVLPLQRRQPQARRRSLPRTEDHPQAPARRAERRLV